jgi:hypothetical protein
LRQPLHQLRHQLIGMVHGRARFVNETRLNIAPSISKIPFYTVSEKRLYFLGIVTIAVLCHGELVSIGLRRACNVVRVKLFSP